MVKTVVEKLKEDGIACWLGLFNNKEILSNAQHDSENLIKKAYSMLENLPDKKSDTRDHDWGHGFLRNYALADFGRTWVRLDGWSGDGRFPQIKAWLERAGLSRFLCHKVVAACRMTDASA